MLTLQNYEILAKIASQIFGGGKKKNTPQTKDQLESIVASMNKR